MSELSPITFPPLGFLAVEIDIHRPPGDPFHERTWPFPIIRELVPGTSESQLVSSTAYDDAFLDRFATAAKRLAERGAVGVITSCGFLALAQTRHFSLAARVPIPVCTSALAQIPSIRAFLPPGQVVGILTYDSARLTDAHLLEIGIDPANVRIRGCSENGHLRDVVARGAKYNQVMLEYELVAEASALAKQCPNMGAIVLECTQMPPYAEAIQKAVGIPIYDVYTMGTWFYSGLVRRSPQQWL